MRDAKARLGWSDERVAEFLLVSVSSVEAWRRGEVRRVAPIRVRQLDKLAKKGAKR